MRWFAALLLTLGALTPPEARAFCGFYVAKADASLYNRASRVVIARDGDRNVVTMANDYQGLPTEFAMVVPVPVVIRQGDVKVVDKAVIDAVDAFSAPRLAEYHDPDPCAPTFDRLDLVRSEAMPGAGPEILRSARSRDLGVTIEAEYRVEEYEVLVLSATQSAGLETFLRQEGYRLPPGAREVLGSYIQQDMRFFVAKVNAADFAGRGFTELRPLQVHYTSPKFMLPIRLGTVNAQGAQDLLIFTVTRHGRVETTNYRTVPVPTDAEVPPWVEDDFGSFYKAVFDRLLQREGRQVVVQEYAWPLSILCDPCSSDPLTRSQLQALGASWVEGGGGKLFDAAFLTRLHVRYDAATFPMDLRFTETRDTRPTQGRYVIRHPFTGDLSCDAGQRYARDLVARQQRERETLASLTGWSTWQAPQEAPRRDPGSWIPEVSPRLYWEGFEECLP